MWLVSGKPSKKCEETPAEQSTTRVEDTTAVYRRIPRNPEPSRVEETKTENTIEALKERGVDYVHRVSSKLNSYVAKRIEEDRTVQMT